MATLSALLCNYNHGKTVGRAIEAMATQSRPPDELIVVDDGSTDHSASVIEPLAVKYPFLRFLRNERNRGVHASFSRALAEMRGEYLYGAAADDYILPGFFSAAMAAAESHPQAGLHFGWFDMISPSGFRIATPTLKSVRPGFLDPGRYFREVVSSRPRESFSPATIFRTAAFLEVGGLRPDLRSYGDHFAIWAIGLKHGACHLAKSFARFLVDPGSYGSSNLANLSIRSEVIRNMAALMRSAEFRDRFPTAFVDDWERTNLRQAEPVPLELEAVRDAFIETAAVVGRNPLLGLFAAAMRVTRSRRRPPPPAEAPRIPRLPMPLGQAFVDLAPWDRPGSKAVALVLDLALRVFRWTGGR